MQVKAPPHVWGGTIADIAARAGTLCQAHLAGTQVWGSIS